MEIEFSKVKIFVTAPKENIETIRNAVCGVGAGVIGDYSYCTFAGVGIGSFVPNEKANPHIGTNNKLEFVEEVKLEFVCDIANVKTVLKNLREVHPYEEPAIDIVPILDESVFN